MRHLAPDTWNARRSLLNFFVTDPSRLSARSHPLSRYDIGTNSSELGEPGMPRLTGCWLVIASQLKHMTTSAGGSRDIANEGKLLPERSSRWTWDAATGDFKSDKHSEVVVFSLELGWCEPYQPAIMRLRLNPLKTEDVPVSSTVRIRSIS